MSDLTTLNESGSATWAAKSAITPCTIGLLRRLGGSRFITTVDVRCRREPALCEGEAHKGVDAVHAGLGIMVYPFVASSTSWSSNSSERMATSTRRADTDSELRQDSVNLGAELPDRH